MGQPAPGINHTVLVLEDDDSSRFVLREILARHGYGVLDTHSSVGAVEICRSHPESICLMIADVVLRGTGGPETIRQIKELRPNMPILFVSGYSLEYLDNRGMIDRQDLAVAGTDFLQKPFTAQTLLEAARNLIR